MRTQTVEVTGYNHPLAWYKDHQGERFEVIKQDGRYVVKEDLLQADQSAPRRCITPDCCRVVR